MRALNVPSDMRLSVTGPRSRSLFVCFCNQTEHIRPVVCIVRIEVVPEVSKKDRRALEQPRSAGRYTVGAERLDDPQPDAVDPTCGARFALRGLAGGRNPRRVSEQRSQRLAL